MTASRLKLVKSHFIHSVDKIENAISWVIEMSVNYIVNIQISIVARCSKTIVWLKFPNYSIQIEHFDKLNRNILVFNGIVSITLISIVKRIVQQIQNRFKQLINKIESNYSIETKWTKKKTKILHQKLDSNANNCGSCYLLSKSRLM